MFFPPFVWRHIKNLMLQEIREKKYREQIVLQQFSNNFTHRLTTDNVRCHPFYVILQYPDYAPATIVKEYHYIYTPSHKTRRIYIYAVYNDAWKRDRRQKIRAHRIAGGLEDSWCNSRIDRKDGKIHLFV